MGLNKQKGNMYPWITHTWNPIRGKCPHDCSYCYMKRIPNVGELRFVEKEMNTNLGKGNKIFVGSSTDIWTDDSTGCQRYWIENTIAQCVRYSENWYIFQSKNPNKYSLYISLLENIHDCTNGILLGTTIETNKEFGGISKAPEPYFRMCHMIRLILPKFVSIEPIMDFDLPIMVKWIEGIHPKFVSIGADSGHNNLPEPPAWKVKRLIEELEQFTEVRVKNNLKRILNETK
jgi:protein gp37